MEWSAPQDEADFEVLDCGVFPRLPSFADIFASSFDDVLVPLKGLSYDPQERKIPVTPDDSCDDDNNIIPGFSALIFCLPPLETHPAITPNAFPYIETPPRQLPTLLPRPPRAPAYITDKETQKEGRQEEMRTQGSNAVVGGVAATSCSCEGCTKQEKAASLSVVAQEVDGQRWASAKADGVRADILDAGGLIDGAVGMLGSSIGSFRNFCPAALQRQRKIVLREDVRNW